jgi:hypothetical protein
MKMWKYLIGLSLLLPVAGWGQTFSNLTTVSNTINNLFSTNLAWSDYDGDGDQDLYVTNWGTATSVPTNRLYRNEGDGTFVDVAESLGVDNSRNSTDAAWGDYDSDGDPDLYLGTFFSQDFLYQNNGDSFAEVGRGEAGINREDRGNVVSVAWGDYNNDGHLDIYLGKYYFANELYHNNGDGTFTLVEKVLDDKRDTDEVNWVDYDNDGDQDLYVVNREQNNGLYRNDQGIFSEIACALSIGNKEIGQSGSWADYDNDGDLDLYLANIGGNALYRNDGGAAFVDVGEAAGVRTSGAGWITTDVTWADYDGDGDQDFYLATGGDRQPQSDVLFANNGDGTFSNVTVDADLLAASTYHMAAAWGDYSGEGAPDLYITDGFGSFGRGNILFQNNTSGSNFIRVQIQGKGAASGGSNTSGIGAQVRLVDAANGALVAYQQVLLGGQMIFGAPAGPYNIEVTFLGNAIASIESNVNGGDSRTIVEP